MSAKMFSRSLLAAAILASGIGSANAQSLEASSTQAAQGAVDHVVTVTFTNTTPETIAGYNFAIPYDSTKLTIDPATAFEYSGTTNAACNVNASAILCFVFPNGADPLLPATDEIKVKVTVDANAAVGPTPLAFEAARTAFSDATGNTVQGTTTDGQIDITTGGGTPPAGADAAFNPAAGGTVTFPGGASGAATQGSITMTVTGGNAGDQATLNNCALSGADATDFILATPMPLNVSTGGNGQIEVTSTVGAAARTATLTCELTDSNDAATPVSWTLNVPAAGGGGTPGNPMYSSNPAPGATISATGDAGMTVMRNVVITNAGGDGLEYTCTVTGTGFAITSGDSGANIAANGTATVALQFTFPAAGTTETGTLECTHNATGSPVTYPLSATGRAAGRATPTMVPASSLWSQIAMFGLFGALGMLVLGLRRGR